MWVKVSGFGYALVECEVGEDGGRAGVLEEMRLTGPSPKSFSGFW